MRFAVAFSLTLAVCAVIALLSAHEFAAQAGRLWDDVAAKLTRAMK